MSAGTPPLQPAQAPPGVAEASPTSNGPSEVTAAQLGKSNAMSAAGAARGAEDLFGEKSAAVEEDRDVVLTTKERFIESKGVYEKCSAKNRGARVHTGPLTMPAARKPPDRTKWLRENKQFHPYTYFENPDNKPDPLPKKKREPPKLWLPLSSEEHAREVAKKKKESKLAMKTGKKPTDGDDASTSASVCARRALEERPPWDEEHHIMVSKANEEVQVYCREYFSKPKRKEGEGIPKVRQLYCMNDRQAGWCDLPDKLGEPRRTFLNWVGEYNVGGPKCQQLPSYWRKLAEKGEQLSSSKSAPSLNATIDGVIKAPLEQNFLERLAQMPASQSSEFWRGWAQYAKNRVPEKKEEPKPVVKKEKGRKAWLKEREEAEQQKAVEAQKKGAGEIDGAAMALTSPAMFPLSDGINPRKRPEWNERWGITHSKDNPGMCKGHQQYFSSAQFLSGAEYGHPGAYLGLERSKWRDVAKNVSHFPVGADGRGAIGRRCLLV